MLSGLSKGLAYVGTTITGMGGGLSSIDLSDLPRLRRSVSSKHRAKRQESNSPAHWLMSPLQQA